MPEMITQQILAKVICNWLNREKTKTKKRKNIKLTKDFKNKKQERRNKTKFYDKLRKWLEINDDGRMIKWKNIEREIEKRNKIWILLLCRI